MATAVWPASPGWGVRSMVSCGCRCVVAGGIVMASRSWPWRPLRATGESIDAADEWDDWSWSLLLVAAPVG